MKAKGFTKLTDVEFDNECSWRCDYCENLGFEYHGAWIDGSTGEFVEDRWQVECVGCGATAELK